MKATVAKFFRQWISSALKNFFFFKNDYFPCGFSPNQSLNSAVKSRGPGDYTSSHQKRRFNSQFNKNNTSKYSFSSSSPSLTPPAVTFPIFQGSLTWVFLPTSASPSFAILVGNLHSPQLLFGFSVVSRKHHFKETGAGGRRWNFWAIDGRWRAIGSITSRCSGKWAHTLPPRPDPGEGGNRA